MQPKEYHQFSIACNTMTIVGHPNTGCGKRRRRRQELSRPIYLIVGTFVVLLLRNSLLSLLIGDDTIINSSFDIQYFHFADEKPRYDHLDLIDPSKSLKAGGYKSIDSTHREGLIHIGSWIAITDTSLNSDNPQILLLKRGEELVTCPNTWGLVGEHSFRNEEPIETVKRGIKEELGESFSELVNEYGHIQNMTAAPVYYERDYGSELENRIDRQVTYLWLVEMNMEHDGDDMITSPDGYLTLDEEVADHMWITLSDLERWVNEDMMNEEPVKFCHHTIVSLARLVIDRLKLMGKITRSVE